MCDISCFTPDVNGTLTGRVFRMLWWNWVPTDTLKCGVCNVVIFLWSNTVLPITSGVGKTFQRRFPSYMTWGGLWRTNWFKYFSVTTDWITKDPREPETAGTIRFCATWACMTSKTVLVCLYERFRPFRLECTWWYNYDSNMPCVNLLLVMSVYASIIIVRPVCTQHVDQRDQFPARSRFGC